MATKPADIKHLLGIVEAYNAARTNELRVMPVPFPQGYSNPLMDNLYDAATAAAASLKTVMGKIESVSLEVTPRK